MSTQQFEKNWPLQDSEPQRRTPSQKRGEQTCAAILEATAAILAEPGTQPLTTNHIAQRAGVNIATLYRYYADVDDVVAALFQQQVNERRAMLIATVQDTIDLPWQDRVGRVVDAIVEERRRQPSCSSLRRKMQTSPRLMEIERRVSIGASELVGRAMGLYRDIPLEQAQSIALVATDILTASLDLWEQQVPRLDQIKINELKKALIDYLARYLN